MKYYEIQIYERDETNDHRKSIDLFSQKISDQKADPMMIQKIIAVINNLPFPMPVQINGDLLNSKEIKPGMR